LVPYAQATYSFVSGLVVVLLSKQTPVAQNGNTSMYEEPKSLFKSALPNLAASVVPSTASVLKHCLTFPVLKLKSPVTNWS
jgi:hypothetical protein